MHPSRHFNFVVPFFTALLFAASANAQRSQPVQTGDDMDVLTTAHPAVRITARIDDTATASVVGTHPSVVDSAAATIGARVPSSTQLGNLRLVLTPTDDQVLALQTLMSEQQDKTSPNYHKWLTPDTFGQHFGAAPADVAKITAWLQSQGFTIEGVSKSNRIISFAGTVGQVETAFHTEMKNLTVNGEGHIANTTDIAIPAALQSVVQGVASLNDFFPKSNAVNAHKAFLPKPPADYVSLQPLLTLPSGTHYLAPGDAAVIFNSTPLLSANIDGTGQTIAVLGRSDITLSDVQQFRSMFGLKKNDPTFTIIGDDPGINTDDLEAYLDVEWAGGMAPGAAVNFIVGGSNYLNTSGINSAGLYAVDNNIGDIITLSYGACEKNFAASGTAFWNTLWEQAAAQGQSVFVSTGDSNGATCDSSGATFAANGYGVNALGSSAYNVAVGGTMFVDYGPAAYWNAPNQATPFTTATSYIPEGVWSESPLSTTYLNSTSTGPAASSGIAGTGGGLSIFTARPAWQTGSGIPAGSDILPPAGSGTGVSACPGGNTCVSSPHRMVPDISFIASGGHDGNIFCGEGVCSNTSTGYNFGAIGGTSVATPVMASVQALINQKNGGRQGNPNFYYYPLANADFVAGNCQAVNGTVGSPTVTLPAATCNFHDVVSGNNRARTSASDTNGIGFNAAAGFDPASGLGSVNINNVATNWSTVNLRATKTTFMLSPTININHGTPQVFSASVAPSTGSGVPTGDISLIAETTTPGTTFRFTLSGGSYSGNVAGLPGGSYKVHVHYGGDGTFAGSDSASIPVTIGKENSGVSLLLGYFYPGSVAAPVTSMSYGYIADLVSSATSGSGTGLPTGTMTYAVTYNGSPLSGLTLPLDGAGNTALIAGATYSSIFVAANYPVLSPGSYSINVAYSGDASFNPSNATQNFTVTPLTTTGSLNISSLNINSGASVTMNYTVARLTASFFPTLAAYPSGNVVFTDNTTSTTLGTVPLNASGVASLTTTALTAAGTHSITAAYAGDTNYNGVSTGGNVNVAVLTPTTTTFNLGSGYVVGSTVPISVTVSPAASATVNYYDAGLLIGTATSSGTTGVATLNYGNFTAGTHSLLAVFSGTASFASSSALSSPTIGQNTTTLTLDAPVSSTYGQSVSMNGRINRSPNVTAPITLTGNITFYDGATPVGSATPVFLPGGYAYYTATFTVPTLTGGSHTLSAVYLGDNNYSTSTSSTVTLAVAKLSPAITVSAAAAVYNTPTNVPVTATIPLSAALAAPTGSVTFFDGATSLGSSVLTYNAGLGAYTASVTPTLNGGTHTLTAQLATDTNYASATSASILVTVITDNVWVANGNGSVSALTMTGATFSSAISGGGKALAIDNSGNIWSLNTGSNSVAEFTKTGTLVNSGFAVGGINTPTALAIDGQGIVWISNGNNTLSAINPNGTAVWPTGYTIPISTPSSINVDGSGNLWVTSSGDNSVTEVIGAASPVTTPTSTAVKNATLGARP